MKIGLFVGVLLLSGVCLAQNVSTKGESLDKVQLLALLASDVPNSRVATLVVERGITFAPTERYIQLLQKVKADDGVIAAVRVAQRPPAGPDANAASGANGPVERDQILDLLQTGVGSDLLAKLVAVRGIDFEPFDEYLHVYEIAGAQESLLSALRQARSNSGTDTAATPRPKIEPGKPAAESITAKRIRVAGEIQSARLISQPKPDYPALARNARIQGKVRLMAVIAKDGTIDDLKVVSGHPLLVKSAMDTVSKWRYQPWLLNGKPVEVETEIDVNYTLQL